jgi:four helix bundle protein
MGKHNFKELKVWQKARQLVVEIYKISSCFPANEKYSLTSQINRSAVSVSSNIAEGAGRNTQKDFAHFLDVSLGSSYELESQLINAVDLAFVNKEQVKEVYLLLNEVQKMIVGFQKTLR